MGVYLVLDMRCPDANELLVKPAIVSSGKEFEEPYLLGAEDVLLPGLIVKELRRALGPHDPESKRAHDLFAAFFHEVAQCSKPYFVIPGESVVVLDLFE